MNARSVYAPARSMFFGGIAPRLYRQFAPRPPAENNGHDTETERGRRVRPRPRERPVATMPKSTTRACIAPMAERWLSEPNAALGTSPRQLSLADCEASPARRPRARRRPRTSNDGSGSAPATRRSALATIVAAPTHSKPIATMRCARGVRSGPPAHCFGARGGSGARARSTRGHRRSRPHRRRRAPRRPTGRRQRRPPCSRTRSTRR